MYPKHKRFLIILSVMFVILLLAGYKSRSSETAGVEESGQDKFNRLLTYIRNQFEEKNVPGGSIAVIINNVLYYSADK